MEIIPKNMERLRERDAPGNSWTGCWKIQVVDHPWWWKPKHRRSSLSLSPIVEAAARLWVIVVKIQPEIGNFSGQVISAISPLWQGFAMTSVKILDNGVMMWKILHLILRFFIGYMCRKYIYKRRQRQESNTFQLEISQTKCKECSNSWVEDGVI